MQSKTLDFSEQIKQKLMGFEARLEIAEKGKVLSVGDGIARVYGLNNAMSSELLEFPEKTIGLVLNLEEDQVGVALLGHYAHIKEGREKSRPRLI